MGKRVSKKEKYEASIKKAKKVFKRMKKQGVSVKGTVKNTDKRNNNNTLDQYEGEVIRYFQRVSEKHGIVDITELNHEHFLEYLQEEKKNWDNGDLAASHRVKHMRSALESFRIGTIKTDVFKSEIRTVNKKDVKDKLQYYHMRRLSDATSTLSTGIEEGFQVLDHIVGNEEKGIKGSRSKHAEAAYHCFRIATQTGGRVSDIIDKLTPKDLHITDNSVEFRDSKGGLTASVPIEDESAQYLIKLCKNKGPNDPIIRLRKDDGKVMKKESAVRTVERIISGAGERAGLNKEVQVSYKYRDGKGKTQIGTTSVMQKVTHHTARKIFVNSRYDKYMQMTDSERKQELDRRRQDKKVNKKYQQALKRINETRTSGSRGMHGYEQAIFLSSLDARHFRSDVLTMWYLNKAVVEKHRMDVK